MFNPFVSHRLLAAAAAVMTLAAAPTASFAVKNTGGEYNTLYAGLGAKGYDVVSYFTDKRAVPGSDKFTASHGGVTWQFASAEHRDLFKASPVRYAPQFGNYCAMALALNQVVVADPENWLISDGKLYVFGKPAPAGPELFKKDLAGNTSKANSNRAILPKQ